MKIAFRQGLVRHQTDIVNTPTFLIKANGGLSIDLVVSPDTTVVAFAHKESDYLFEEKQSVLSAWSNFTPGIDHWLYWDIDLKSGVRTFGHTILLPTYGPVAPAVAVGQHWFDTDSKQMRVWNGFRWTTVIRVFACEYVGAGFIQVNPIGSQVGLTSPTFAGTIIFDFHERPVRRYNHREAEFVTTESSLLTHALNNNINFKFESQVVSAKAIEPIPKFSMVHVNNDIMELANHTDKVAIGIAVEDLYNGEVGIYQTGAFISNEDWNFAISAPPSKVYYGVNGEITLSIPQTGIFHEVGTVINSDTILLDIKHPIYFI